MADLKISQLTAATTPLAGTEVLPIVQSGSTKKVATDNLTVKNLRSNASTGVLQIAGPAAGTTRTMTTPDANFTAARIDAAQSFTGDQTLSSGNLIISDATKGLQLAKGGNIAAGGTINASTTKTVTITMSGSGSYAVTIIAAMNVYGGGGNAIAQFMAGGDIANNNAASAAVVGPTNLNDCVISGLTLAAGSITFTMQNTNAVQDGRVAVTVNYAQSDGNTATVTIA